MFCPEVEGLHFECILAIQPLPFPGHSFNLNHPQFHLIYWPARALPTSYWYSKVYSFVLCSLNRDTSSIFPGAWPSKDHRPDAFAVGIPNIRVGFKTHKVRDRRSFVEPLMVNMFERSWG